MKSHIQALPITCQLDLSQYTLERTWWSGFTNVLGEGAIMSRLVGWSCLGAVLAALVGNSVTAAPANAAVYCQYVGYPAGCIVRAGAVLRPRPVARAAVATPGVGAPGVGVRAGTPTNRGGPVDRAGRR